MIGANLKKELLASINKCSICNHNDIGEYGNNAEPINSGRCCDWCNNEFVIPKRLENMKEDQV